jgi:phytanoyl-CoA hydroxylase
MPKRLSEAEIEHYWREGWVLVKQLFPPSRVDPWRERVRALSSGAVSPSDNMVLVRDVEVAKGAFDPPTPEHAICKINFFENDAELWSYAEDERLLDCVEDLLGPNLLFVNSMCITKPPGVDGRHPLHQDLLYFGFRPGDAVVGTWTALQTVNRENGCLAVLPGSHRGKLMEHEVPDWEYVNLAFVGVKGVDAAAERVHVEMEAGDTLLFHSLLMHGSGTNKSDDFRRAISVHYASSDAKDLWEGKDRLSTRPFLPVRGEGA